ncbi:hypothetical protein NQT66_13235 [Cellulophaga baltica]|uniref:hypothetical protein n=1 Tax=Cellulophaga baltica TaxID=76594 RepID=UPI0021495515|nr:hypothetical protein [Cellulophaga baltica]MCR1025780.1 hypothetical protein [Cellulophaga baltica]
MDANDVYNVAKALSSEEYLKLIKLLNKDLEEKNKLKTSKKAVVDFTVEDGIKYLIENYFNKVRKP